ncbi:restriction endonuclease subunit S [Roseobacter weihaiensis]|uniref:restriction endonuclease subunit S n=1 Tax=Roseobacter weihaiensis TaxID=2763262 RepID=UPI001D0B704C|nr:restriction endonuclease subunit S [Roseobacter sp. H9]
MSSERSEWALEKCLEVLIDYRGKSPTKSKTGIPVISAKVVKNGRILEPVEQTIDPSYYEEWMRRGLPSVGDVVMTTEAPLGEVARLNARTAQYALGQRIVTMRGRPGCLDNGYLKYLLLSDEMQDRLYRRATGTTVQGISQKALRQVELPLPDFDIQRAIAKILGDLDDKIDLMREINATLEEMARTVFRTWFVDFEPVRAKATGATSFRGMPQELFETLPDSFQPSEIGDIPAGWSSKPLSDLIEVNPARQLKKGVEATYLGMTDVPTSGPAPANWAQRKFTSGMRFKNGDTLLARITPCLENGKTALVDFLDTGEIGWGSTEYIVLAPQGSASREFIYCLARSERFREFAIKNMTGTSGRQRVGHESISGYKMVDPGTEALQAFEQLSKPMFERITANRDEISTLSAFRDTLLPKLISGELDAPSLEDLGLEGGE